MINSYGTCRFDKIPASNKQHHHQNFNQQQQQVEAATTIERIRLRERFECETEVVAVAGTITPSHVNCSSLFVAKQQ